MELGLHPVARHMVLAAAAACLAVLSPVRPAWAAEAGTADGAAVKLTEQDGKVLVEVGGAPFTEYRFAKEEGLPWARPYFYPVRAPDGTELTSDQARTNPKEHPHHRSLWVAQGAVNKLDHWMHAKAGTPQPEQRHVRFDRVGGDTIAEALTWDGPDGKPMLAERRTWRFMAFPDGGRGIDLTSVYTAVAGPVTFGDTKEAGLCSVRLVKAIADTATITLASGAKSARDADKAKKEPGDEAAVWGKPAAWCDLTGKVGGKDYGVAVLDHPSNPRHPARWHVRRYGLLSANVFGLHDFDPKSFPEKTAGDLTIEPAAPVTFRYRVVVHAGDAAAAKLDEKFADFARPAK